MQDFVHLHVHTQYSLLDGAIRIPDLMDAVKQRGMTAVAITDHGNMYGAVDFQKSAQRAGLKPIIGCEQYITVEPHETSRDPKSYHLTLLAKNLVGYRNLMELNSMSWLNGYHQRTGVGRADFALLEKHAEGLICLSGDLGSELNQAILRDDAAGARDVARRYHALFGEDYYIELMHNALPETEKCRLAAIEIADELGIEVVATNDCHYVDPSDAQAQAILMCIQLGKTVELDRLMEHGLDQLYVRSPAEMYELFSDIPQACSNTVVIANKCDLEIPLGEVYLPLYDVPQEFIEQQATADKKEAIAAYFAHVSRRGLQSRYAEFEMLGVEVDKAEYDARLELEIDVICNMDFPGYFLIVWDFIRWAKDHDVPVGPGRGSGAGSLVAYALEITDIDPIPYSLLFERFLNPERVSMPDFDIDFCMNRRGEVIEYVTNKYGKNNVGQIITYGQLKARACIRDVGRALNFSFGETDRIAKMVPDILNISLEDALAQEPRLRDARAEDPRVDTMFEIALRLENLNRQAGMHAAGVVISEEPLWKYVPITRGANGELVTQYAKNEVEEAGLVKFDFLGLKTLTVIDDAVKLINIQRTTAGEEKFDLRRIPMDDQAVYRQISDGHTTGIFQLESSGFTELLKKLKPDCFEDIIAAVALYRPGPLGSGMVDDFVDRKHGRKRVEYPHPWLEEVLKPTYGVMVYQEQVMKTAQVMAGYSLGGADLLRRAMGKKKPEVMAQQKGTFVEGAKALDVDGRKAEEIFDLMAYFAGYGFNKSHSAAYALITYQTAWLKTHYPVEFMAALMTCDADNTAKVVRFINEASSMGIDVLPPSVNDSQLDFSVVDGKIRFGLGAIKGVGAGVIEVILHARKDGPFTSLYDFCIRVDQKQVNKRTLEALVSCGAFDSVAPNLNNSRYIGDIAHARARMCGAIGTAADQGAKKQHDKAVGQSSLFGMMSAAQLDSVMEEHYPDVAPWDDRRLLDCERSYLGFYITGHPLDRYDSEVALYGVTPTEQIITGKKKHQEMVNIAGVVAELRERPTKSGGRMAFLLLEDKSGEVEVMFFSNTYEQFEEVIKSNEPILIKCEVREEGDIEARSFKVRANEVKRLADARRETVRRMRVDVDVDEITNGELKRLRDLFQQHRGPCRTSLRVNMTNGNCKGRAELPLPESFWVEPNDELLMRVERLFRRASVVRLA